MPQIGSERGMVGKKVRGNYTDAIVVNIRSCFEIDIWYANERVNIDFA